MLSSSGLISDCGICRVSGAAIPSPSAPKPRGIGRGRLGSEAGGEREFGGALGGGNELTRGGGLGLDGLLGGRSGANGGSGCGGALGGGGARGSDGGAALGEDR
jgi:hypothetical protein